MERTDTNNGMSIRNKVNHHRDAASHAAHAARMRIRHFLHARYWRGHAVHSPFVYHIVRHVITGHHADEQLRRRMEAYRKSLTDDGTPLMVGSMGAIPRPPRHRTVGEIAAQTSISDKYGRLLSRLAEDFRPHGILELGTSMGVSAAYMSAGCPSAKIVSIEGLEAVAAVAERHLRTAGMDNVSVLRGDIDILLPQAIDALPGGEVEMAFVDANHSRDATLRYFEALAARRAGCSLLVFDDIYWSSGMTEAWRAIVADERVMTTIELPRMGLAYFRPGCTKEHYVVRW